MFETEITIVGVGERRSGLAADGKTWVNQQIAFTYSDKRMLGVNAASATLWNADVDNRVIEPGKKYRVYLCFGKDKNGSYGLRRIGFLG